MQILFVYPNINTHNGLHYPHGLGSLAAVCRDLGHCVDIWMFDGPVDQNQVKEKLSQVNPDFVAFSFSTHQWPYAKSMAAIAGNEGFATIAGGVHATFAKEETAKSVDMVVLGEGEGALTDILNGEAHESISNLYTKTISNELRPLIDDLDSLPIYDRSDFPMDEILRVNGYELSMLAGRGCPWPCTYCCNHAWKKLYKEQGKYVRLRGIERLFSEIDLLLSRYRVESLYFEDDIFCLDKDWVNLFCEEYPKRFNVPFRIYLRVGNIDFNTLSKLKNAGCNWVNVGIESGSDRVRKEILKRSMSDDQIEEFFGWCRKLEITTRAFNIIGFPGESLDEMEQTILLNQKVTPDQVQVSVFHPYPGTELYDQCVLAGIYNEKTSDSYFTGESVLDLPDISIKKLEEIYHRFCDIGRDIEKSAFEKRLAESPLAKNSLLLQWSFAVVTKEGQEPVSLCRVNINGDERFSIFAHPRSRIIFPKQNLAKKVFRVAIALNPLCLEWGGEGVRFAVFINKDGKNELVGEKEIDPKNNPDQQKWNEWEILLPEVDDADLVLATDPYPGNDLTGAWALWGEPRLEDVK